MIKKIKATAAVIVRIPQIRINQTFIKDTSRSLDVAIVIQYYHFVKYNLQIE